jgi:beta-lactamase superfamily II metal-dependent hydrolase
MPLVKAFAVGEGDTTYIIHGSDNFTIIDCCIKEHNKTQILDELRQARKGKGIHRFISTHPDEDHFGGIEWLDDDNSIVNFYVVKNQASKTIETESFKRYCKLRDGEHAFYISKGCSRKWMNQSDDERGSAGIDIHWPDLNNEHFKKALADAKAETSYNNLSAVIRYIINDGPSFMWLGDLEKKFMEDIESSITLPQTTVVFASHHGRDSGKIPNSWLDKLKPQVIIIGEAPSRHLNYYQGYSTITQNRAGDVTMDCIGRRIDFYVGNANYAKRDWLDDEGHSTYPNYIGTLNL